ncbi:hypothetical protein D3C83_21950 [compost metagenome]
MPARRLGLVDAELHDRDVGFRIHVLKHRPGAVIEPPAAVERDRRRSEQLRDARSERGRAGRGIFHLVQLGRKAAEVVDGPPARTMTGWGGVPGLPVGSFTQTQARTAIPKQASN